MSVLSWISRLFPVALCGAGLLLSGCGESAAESDKKVDTRVPVVIESIPSGAVIVQNGKELGLTPKSMKARPSIQHIKLMKVGYEPEFVDFTVEGPAEQKVKVPLRPMLGSVLITSVPSGAQVVMDGKVLGNTPYVCGRLKCGTYSAQIRKSGFSERRAEWEIRDGRPVKVAVNLESNVGRLVVKSTPANANVYLNGKIVGVTPYQSELEEGGYKLKLELPSHIEFNGAVTVNRDKTSEVAHLFSKLPGGLSIVSKPAGASVRLDGRDAGKTPLLLKNLAADREYEVKIAKQNFGEETRTVRVEPGVVSELLVDMSVNAGGVDLVVGPPGVTVYLDNEKVKVAEVDPEGSGLLAKVIEFRELLPGKHIITIAHKRGLPDRKSIEVNVLRGEIVRPENLTLWIPNVEIYYKDGQSCTGVMYGEDPEKGIWFEDVRSRGARGYINRSLVREIKKLDINE